MNTAGRLLATYERLLNHRLGNDVSMLKVWAHVFDLPADDQHLEDAVVMCLQATRSEIEVLRTRLAGLGVPEDLMHPGIARLRTHTSTANINANWNNFREEASKPENKLSFKWANWAGNQFAGHRHDALPA